MWHTVWWVALGVVFFAMLIAMEGLGVLGLALAASKVGKVLGVLEGGALYRGTLQRCTL